MRRNWGIGALALLMLAGCGGASSKGDGPSGCRYEVQSTGCNNSTYGAWEKRCTDDEEPSRDLTQSELCALAVSDTSECAGGCCVRFRFRNAVGFSGTCTP
jgi:hypothetical protein